ncbi:MAG: TonB-dependent receptor plug domain-containing protein [Gammaproteobacteria bacterium]|nr:TonB-dependent receptor plug domain-containing protein [Gammaproteobacteria bacterium]
MHIKLTAITVSILLAVISAQAHGNNDKCQDDDCVKAVEKRAKKTAKPAKEQHSYLEVIEVKGRRLNPMSRNAEGSYTLDNDLIKDYRFGNGNLNDILGILPGVQYGESALNSSNVSNIKPSEVSLSGAQGHQSSYNIDGVNNNSRLSTGNAEADRNLLQDVTGHSQSTFVNLDLLDSIEVYDSNIPAKYGQFSGGLVNVHTTKATDKPTFGITYRQTATDWTQFHVIKGPSQTASREVVIPQFNKQSLNLYLTTPLSADSGLVAQFQWLKSEEIRDQLGTAKNQQQTNGNMLLKYHYNVTINDEITLNAYYAPYQGEYFDANAKNSDFNIKGGGYSVSGQWIHDDNWGDITTKIGFNRSENSKTSPNYWFTWDNINGKPWGNYNNSIISLEGGYGDIDKIQQTVNLSSDLNLIMPTILGAQSLLNLGVEISQQQQQFNRLTDSILYNGAFPKPGINCGSYTFDCIETQFKQPVSELEQQLGRPIDYSNGDDMLIYDANVIQAGQFFTTRQLAPKSNVSVTVNNLALYGELSLDYAQLNVVAGVRYDYNDFFEQHNIAPRFRMSLDVFDDQRHQITTGFNRYYQADLTHYKLNQAMTPMHQEVRHSYLNQPQSWQAELTSTGYLYRFTETKTPYSDEFSLAYRYQLLGGTLEAKWLNRYNKQAVNRTKSYNDDGQAILTGTNAGSSHYQRYSLSWMAKFDQQHIELNFSKASNTVDQASFDRLVSYDENKQQTYAGTENSDDSDLVFFQYEELVYNKRINQLEPKTKSELISRHDLALESQDYNRPYIANASWGIDVAQWQISLQARYVSGQEAVYATGLMLAAKLETSTCDGCKISEKSYPLYAKYDRPSYWQLNGSLKYNWDVTPQDRIVLSFEGQNILNQRSYQIGPLGNGSELGRRFWLGISYQH